MEYSTLDPRYYITADTVLLSDTERHQSVPMNAAFFSIAKHLRRTLQTTLQSQLMFVYSTRRYYARGEARGSRLQSALWPLGPPSADLGPQIERWIDKGNSVRQPDLQRVIKGLRKIKRFKQALQVSEWMQSKSNFPFRPADHAIQLDLIGAVHGLSTAEDYFNKLPEKERTEKTYGALLHCYVREHLEEKAVAHMQKMKQLGLAFSPIPYNDIMCLYAATGQHKKVQSMLGEMKENGVFPNNFSYKMCINSCGVRSDISSMEKLLEEMEQQPQIVMDWNTYTTVANIYVKSGFPDKSLLLLKKAEEKLEKGDAVACNQLISLYGRLGDKSAIWRLWELQKKQCKKLINRDYTTMLAALVKIGELQEAETLLKEWESGQILLDFRVPNVLLVGYQTNGLIEKAEALLDEFVKNGKKLLPHSWGIVAAGYAEKGEMEKVCEMMKNALEAYMPNAGWTPNHEIITSILCYLGANSNLEDVETFIGLLKVARPMDGDMYCALIRARIRAGKGVDDLLKGMQDDGIKENKDIKEILALNERKSN